MRFAILFVTFLYHIVVAEAATWYFLRWVLPGGGQGFTRFTGKMKVPRLPRAGKYWIWPGLQAEDNSGVLQHVIDGESGRWFVGSAFCCNDDKNWVPGYDTSEGQTISFSFVKNGNVWETEISGGKTGNGQDPTRGRFSINQRLNQVLLAIELTGVPWDFGAFEFTDLVMEADTTSTAFCLNPPENYGNAANIALPSSLGIIARVVNGRAQCSISYATLRGPR